MLVAGLDLGGSAVKAWVRELEGPLRASAVVPVPALRDGHRVELDPDTWLAACHQALSQVAHDLSGWAGLTVCSLRQGFVLLDGADDVLGNGVLNSDRRGAPYAEVLAGRHSLTGHWPAPELTLPKLLAVQAEEPDRWAATRRVLFLHDWLIACLTGVHVTEASYACAGGMADVAARDWARELLADCGIGTDLLAPIVEAGTIVGSLLPGWPLPPGTPVVAGCGDTQVAAMGAGGLHPGVVTVVAGSSTPVAVTLDRPVQDPLARAWVSTHAAPDRWVAEGNAGYPGSFAGWWSGLAAGDDTDDPAGVVAVTAVEHWAQDTWQTKPPWSLLGLRPDTTAGQVQRALLEAHAFSVAGSVDDLGRLADVTDVVVTGGAADDGALPALLAQVLGRDIRWDTEGGASLAGAALVGRALGKAPDPLPVPPIAFSAGDPGPLALRRSTWTNAVAALREALPS
ncbi:MAG: FGGY-family carbohydrate kinase [Mycobacteriales bacterium]